MDDITHLYAVAAGQTVWEEQGRVDMLAGSPLSEQGREVIRRVGLELVPHEPTAIYAATGEAESEAAKILSRELGLKVRLEQALCEIDFGLWQGLTMDEIRRRQPRLHKQWFETPGSVRPPGGETLAEAQERIWSVLREIIRRERRGGAVVVLRPVVLGLLRCRLEHADIDDIWTFQQQNAEWTGYQVDEEDLAG